MHRLQGAPCDHASRDTTRRRGPIGPRRLVVSGQRTYVPEVFSGSYGSVWIPIRRSLVVTV